MRFFTNVYAYNVHHEQEKQMIDKMTIDKNKKL
jgi:hypothetical protein